MKNQKINFQLGFTVVELLVVCVIMATLSTLVMINWNSQRAGRSLTIAQNEAFTNIKKIQSYAVSSRNLSTGIAPKYYVIRFEKNSSNYAVGAVAGDDYEYYDVETIRMPSGVSISDLVLTPQGIYSGDSITHPDCIFAIFSVTYGKTYFAGSGGCRNDITDTIRSFPDLAPKSNYNLGLVFSSSQTSVLKGVSISGLSGKVETYIPQINNGPKEESDGEVEGGGGVGVDVDGGKGENGGK